jgi:hypothetical protein
MDSNTMTSTSANLPSSTIASNTSPLAGLMQVLAAQSDSGPRAATTDFSSLLSPGASRSPRAALPNQALSHAAIASQPGLLAAFQAVAVEPVVPIEKVGTAEPLRAALETSAALLISLVQALPVEEAAPLAGAPTVEVTVVIPGEPEFTVSVPRTLNPAAADALTHGATRIAGHEASGNPKNAPQGDVTRAVQTLTALAGGLRPPKVERGAESASAGVVPGAIEAEIALPAGGSIRLAIKPAGTSEADPKTGSAESGAEIALSKDDGGKVPNSTVASLKKSFLSIVDKQLRGEGRGSGIAAAKFGANMPEQAPTTLPQTFGAVKAAEMAGGLATGVSGVPVESAELSESLPSGARRAVDTALNLMEIQAGQRGRDLSTVSVRMKFAGEDLAIRVEMRGGEVRTSFLTASPDLRAAISREWQAASTEWPLHLLRFNEPEFSNGDRNLADRGASEQHNRDNDAAREQAQARREAGIAHATQNRAPSDAPSILPAAVADVIAPGSLHLSTFA